MTAAFGLGAVVATPGALAILASGSVDLADHLARHARGDLGDLGDFDRHANDRALKAGEPIFSSYGTLAGRV